MPFSHNGLKATTGIHVFSQVNKYTLSYRFLYGNVQGCVFAKTRPVSLNWTDFFIQESQEASLFPAGDHKAAMNREESMTNINNKNDPQKKHRLVTVKD